MLIAGCGWGKTLVYFLSLELWQDCVILVISPLKTKMQEQHQSSKPKRPSSTAGQRDV
jgi:superfamily II DNA helicase RecQ